MRARFLAGRFGRFQKYVYLCTHKPQLNAHPNAPMAESVDASVSNTDRETCAGSTPARSTATDWQSQRLSVCLFLLRLMRRQASVDSGAVLSPSCKPLFPQAHK